MCLFRNPPLKFSAGQKNFKCWGNEARCATPEYGQFACAPIAAFCDHRRDCLDGSDEWDLCGNCNEYSSLLARSSRTTDRNNEGYDDVRSHDVAVRGAALRGGLPADAPRTRVLLRAWLRAAARQRQMRR